MPENADVDLRSWGFSRDQGRGDQLSGGESIVIGPGTLFVSYARADDERFVSRIHDDLEARGFDLWWDRRRMPNRGLAFLREIRDAVTESERLLLVLGPSAVDSDHVRAEWQYASSIGIPVVTLLRLGDYEQLPRSLSQVDVLDFRSDDDYAVRLETLVRQLHEPVAPLGRLVGVPDLPPQFQPRPADLATVRAALLRDSHEPVVVTAAGRRAGMQGMGGVGKSVLAAAVARDFDVRRAFPDGVVWVTLGADPPLHIRLAEVCRAFGDAAATFIDPEDGRARLSELLADRASLLVLDDASQLGHVRAFDALGPTCSLLLTTRDERLLDEVAATKHRVDVLSPDDSLRLMAAWLAAPEATIAEPDFDEHTHAVDELVAGMSDEARDVARECGYLPLALALSAALVRDGVDWNSVLEALREADLQYLDHPNGSVFKSISVGVDALEHEDARFARHYLELAVFPHGEAMPEAAMTTLWLRAGGINRRTADKLLNVLARRALIRLVGEPTRRSVGLHDLQHDYLRSVAGDPAALHANLLDAYRGKIAGDWSQGPNDGYFFQHLAQHLVKANRGAELCTLLTSSPAWLDTQFTASGGHTQYAADVELALATPAGQRPVERIALATARQVITSRIGVYSDVALEVLARLGRTAEALSYARLRTEPRRRIRALVQLNRVLVETNQVGEDLLDEAVGAMAQIKLDDFRAEAALENLSLALFEADRPVEALQAVGLAIEYRGSYSPYAARNRVVATLVERQRFSDAAGVARALPDRGRADELLRVARAARGAGMRAFARVLVAEAVSDVRATPVGTADTSIFETLDFDSKWRTDALQAAAEILGPDDSQSRGLWAEAVDVIDRSDGYKDSMLKEIAEKLARLGETELVLRAISATSYPDHFWSFEASGIVDRAAEAGRFGTARAVAEGIKEPQLRAHALIGLALAIHEAGHSGVDAVLSDAVALTDEIDPASNVGATSAYGTVRTQTLCSLAEALHRMDDPRADEMLDRAAVDARGDVDREHGRAEALALVAQSVSRSNGARAADKLLDEALALAGDDDDSPFNLAVMIAEIGDADRALAAALMVGPKNRSSALGEVAEAFAETARPDAVRRAVDLIDDPDLRASVLGKAATALAATDRTAARAFFEEALANRSWSLGFVLIGIGETAACWSPDLIELALSLVPEVAEPRVRLWALQAFLPHVAQRGMASSWNELIQTAGRLDLLSRIEAEIEEQTVTALDAGHFEVALLLAASLLDDARRSSLLSRIAVALAGARDPRALEVARSAESDDRMRALEAVALARANARDGAAAAILEEALSERARGADAGERDSAVRQVSNALATLGDRQAAVVALRAIVEERERAAALAEIAPALVRGGLQSGVEVAGAIACAPVRARALLALADATGDRALLRRALSEAAADDTPAGDVSADWIATLCESASGHAAEDRALAVTLLDAARSACARISDGAQRSKQQAAVARALAGLGWLDDALAAARAVEDAPRREFDELDYESANPPPSALENVGAQQRAEAIAFVAECLARAGRAENARSAAAEADEIVYETTMVIASLVYALPPEGWDSANRRRIEALIAERDTPRSKAASEDRKPAVSEDEEAVDWARLTEVQGLEKWLAALATAIRDSNRQLDGAALAGLKEATRIAGWVVPTWQLISESITVEP